MDPSRKLSTRICRLWTGSIRNRLILGISALLAIVMSVFVVDMGSRQADYLHRESQEEATVLAQTLAANSVSWALASDLAGLQEVVQVLKGYPDVRYAMVLARDGKVLAHTDPRLPGRYARDPVSDSLLRAPLAPQLLVNTASLVDVAAPIQANGALIGWARVSLSQDRVNDDLRAIARNGIIYAAIAVVLGILLAVALTRGLTRDLTRLVKAARRIGAGERGVQSSLAREDELGELSGALDGMSSDLDRASQALREDEQNYRSLADSAPALIWASGTDKLCNYFNQPWLNFTGRTLEQELGHGWTEGVHPDDFAQCLATYAGAFDRREPFSMEYRLRRHDGEYRWVRDHGCPRYDSRGEFIGYLGYVMDITERRRMEGALQQSEEKFRLLTEKSVVGIYIVQDTKLVYVNPSLATTFGYSPEEIIGKFSLKDLIHRDDIQLVMRRFQERLEGRTESSNLVYKGLKKDGSVIYIETYGMVIDYQGRPAVMGSLMDITERRRAHEAVAASEKKFRDLVETASDWVWEVDEDGAYTYCSPRVRDLLGYEPAELIGKSPFDLMPAAEAARVAAIFRSLFAERKPLTGLENINLRKDGREAVLETSGVPVFDSQGAFNGYRGIDRDITERRRAEREALEQVKLAEAFFNHSVSGLVILDRNFNFVRVNEAYARACRKEIGEFAGRNHFEMYPSDTQAIFEEVVRTKRPYATFTRAFVYPDQPERGTTYWDWTLVPILDEQGEVEYLVFSLSEVTERKRAEDALQRSEASLKEAQRIAHVGNWELDLASNVLTWTEEIYRIFEVDPREFDASYEAFVNAIHPDDRERVDRAYTDSVKNKKPYDIVHRLLMKDGRVKYVNERCETAYDPSGRPLRSIGTVQDVTARRQAEEALREREEFLDKVVENIPDMIFVKDAQALRFVRLNQAGEQLLGYPRENLLGKSDYDFFPKEEADFFTAKDREVLGNKGLVDIPEETIKTRAQGERILHTKKIPIVDDEGRPQYLLGISEDITERKRAEAVRTQLAAIVQSSHDAIIGKDLEGIITSWNPGAEKIYGYRAEEVVGKPVSLLATESREHEIADLLENVRRAEAVINFETVRIRKDGTCIDISLDLSPIKDAAGRIVGASTIARDITEKKQAERALRKVNRALKALSSCNEALIHATDEKRLLNEICRIIVDIEGYRLAWVGYVEHDAQQTIRPVAQSGYEPGYMEHADITWADNERGRGPLGIAIRSGRIQVVQDVSTDPRFEPWRANAARLGYGSVLVAPLVADSRVIGALSIHAEGADAFDAGEIALLSELAADMAFGIVTLRTRGAHEQSAERLQRSMEATVQVIASTVEMRDPYTAGHQRRVAELATSIARELGLTEDQVHAVHLAGVVHDLGKIHIPAEILSKPGRLSAVEFELIKSHPEAGYDILKGVDFPWPIAQIVYQHHERLDGSGYPRGLKADEILLEARILTVADVVEAMSSHRPYRPSLGVEPALQEISAKAGRCYDADVVRACLALFREKGFAFKA